MESKKRKMDEEYPRVTYLAPNRTFERLLKEQTLEETKQTVRGKLGLPSGSAVELSQVRDGMVIDLEDDDDFEAFVTYAHISGSVEVRALLPDDASGSLSNLTRHQEISAEPMVGIDSQQHIHGPSQTSLQKQPHDVDVDVSPKKKKKRKKKSSEEGENRSVEDMQSSIGTSVPASPTRSRTTGVATENGAGPSSATSSRNVSQSLVSPAALSTTADGTSKKRKRKESVAPTVDTPQSTIPSSLPVGGSTSQDGHSPEPNKQDKPKPKRAKGISQPSLAHAIVSTLTHKADAPFSATGDTVALASKSPDAPLAKEATGKGNAKDPSIHSNDPPDGKLPPDSTSDTSTGVVTSTPSQLKERKPKKKDEKTPSKDGGKDKSPDMSGANTAESSSDAQRPGSGTDSTPSLTKSEKKKRKRKSTTNGDIIPMDVDSGKAQPTSAVEDEAVQSILESITAKNKARTAEDVLSHFPGYGPQSPNTTLPKPKKVGKSKLSQSWTPPPEVGDTVTRHDLSKLSMDDDGPFQFHDPPRHGLPRSRGIVYHHIPKSPTEVDDPLPFKDSTIPPTESRKRKSKGTNGCQICHGSRMHARKSCPVIKAGSDSVGKRLDELLAEDESAGRNELIAELRLWFSACTEKEVKKARMEAKKAKKAEKDAELEKAAAAVLKKLDETHAKIPLDAAVQDGKTASQSNDSETPPKIPEGSKTSSKTTDKTTSVVDAPNRAEESSDESSGAEGDGGQKPRSSTAIPPLTSIDPEQDPLEALVRGPARHISAKDIPSSPESAEEEDEEGQDDLEVSEEEDKWSQPYKFRKRAHVSYIERRLSSPDEAPAADDDDDDDDSDSDNPGHISAASSSRRNEVERVRVSVQAGRAPPSPEMSEAHSETLLPPLLKDVNDGGESAHDNREGDEAVSELMAQDRDDMRSMGLGGDEAMSSGGQEGTASVDGGPGDAGAVSSSMSVTAVDKDEGISEGEDNIGTSIFSQTRLLRSAFDTLPALSVPSTDPLEEDFDAPIVLVPSSSAVQPESPESIEMSDANEEGNDGTGSVASNVPPSTPPRRSASIKLRTPGTVNRMKDRFGKSILSPSRPAKPITTESMEESMEDAVPDSQGAPTTNGVNGHTSSLEVNVSPDPRRSLSRQSTPMDSVISQGPPGRPPRHTLVPIVGSQPDRQSNGDAKNARPSRSRSRGAKDALFLPQSSNPEGWTTLPTPKSSISSRASIGPSKAGSTTDQDDERAEVDELVSEANLNSQVDAVKQLTNRESAAPEMTNGQPHPPTTFEPVVLEAPDSDREPSPAQSSETEESEEEEEAPEDEPKVMVKAGSRPSLPAFRSLTDLASQEDLFSPASTPAPSYPLGPVKTFGANGMHGNGRDDDDDDDDDEDDDSDSDSAEENNSHIPEERRAGAGVVNSKKWSFFS
ncbi:hypothetical protein BD410DRAFT_208373 [Rickenella mellea]|uniref:Uncharacterized protein n=1 Tax=Rickenella mellea TaxID=50990 RepID=A0A4Y7Q5Z3_9AGAM|nr:hypothetical protein BD410DRAFT_208373 [Rickenella mellea]